MKPQVWSFVAAVVAAILTLWSALRLQPGWATIWLLVAAGFWMLTGRWNRNDPIPFPYAFRWFLRLPRPAQSPRHLLSILQPHPGERILEIGPGIGAHALRIASGVAPGGVAHVVDVQPKMARGVLRRARARGIANITGCAADAARLPYADGTFDGAYLITVLGEVPDGDGAVRELFRVLKPTAPLVVGELLFDPDFVSFRNLRRRVERVGFVFRRKTGGPVAYLARFEHPN